MFNFEPDHSLGSAGPGKIGFSFDSRYVFGFGLTEDVPYGFTLGYTGGYVRQLKIDRQYAAFKLNYTKPYPKGNIMATRSSI